MKPVCPVCEGSGMQVVVRPDGNQYATPCECQTRLRDARAFASARIPKRYEHCSFESFETNFPGADPSLSKALIVSKGFVDLYPLESNGNGLLITGSIGVGKTHLAVSTLRSLIVDRGATGIFYDYRQLLKEIQNSYNKNVNATEYGVLQPVFAADVLVLDELGASKPTDWMWDMVAYILNTRYNDKRTTIITANYFNEPPYRSDYDDTGALGNAKRANTKETLGDRIGERMRSRLQEMCVPIQMTGEDFRQTVKRASFA